MKRLWRWLVMLLVGVSLLICVGAGIVWVRSYCIADQFFWINDISTTRYIQVRYTINSSNGGVEIWHMYVEYPDQQPQAEHSFTYEHTQPFGYPYLYIGNPNEWMSRKIIHIKGFEISYDREGVDRMQSMTFPMGAIFFAALLPPAIWLRREIKRRRRFKKGHCRRCGYDLRATPERCPECGMIPVTTKA